MNSIPVVTSLFTGYGKNPMNYAMTYANDIKKIIERYCLKEYSAFDLFCESMAIVENKDNDYLCRKQYFDSAIFLFACFEEVRTEFEYCPNEIALAKRFARRDRKNLNSFEDGINYNAPEQAGLYFIGETHFNPFTKEEFYWIKIGLSTNLAKRMKQYNTCCPMLWRIAFKTNLNKCLENEEEEYHDKLRKIAIASCNHNEEWFLVDRETYLEMCEKGFSYFD